ncbi:MAG: hypothetical protein R3A45_09830 [Bdellovibrionota bacterium]
MKSKHIRSLLLTLTCIVLSHCGDTSESSTTQCTLRDGTLRCHGSGVSTTCNKIGHGTISCQSRPGTITTINDALIEQHLSKADADMPLPEVFFIDLDQGYIWE